LIRHPWFLIPLSGLIVFSACTEVRPVIRENSYAPVEPSLEKLTILPLFTSRELMSEEGAASIHRFVIEALDERGVAVIPLDPLAVGLPAELSGAPRADLDAVARDVVQRLEATGLLLGEVSRYGGRVGARRAVSQPASVAFALALYEVPSGRRLWSGWFDETQQALGESPRERVRLPGGGLRWLTAGELARWGAAEMVKAMLTTR
jgi:hypothetical protein